MDTHMYKCWYPWVCVHAWELQMLLYVNLIFYHMCCMCVVLTLDRRQHSASHGQHKAQRTAQQEAVWHLKVESARVQHQTGVTAASLYTFFHQTKKETWTQNVRFYLPGNIVDAFFPWCLVFVAIGYQVKTSWFFTLLLTANKWTGGGRHVRILSM